jgi:hypothetical protein
MPVNTRSQYAMPSVRTLLHGIVDYAGLFPPAALDMADAVRSYAAYRAGGEAWMLGRFVLPVARIGEFERVASESLPDGQGESWRLSAILGGNVRGDSQAVRDFNERHGGAPPAARRAVIEAVELRVGSVDEIERAGGALPEGVEAYFEIPAVEDPRPLVYAVARAGGRAKVRTGGVTRDAFPSVEQLARFLHACVKADVPFKATAGLHHAICADYPLTYEPDGETAPMFGFLNLFLAAALLLGGASMGDAQALLEEGNATAFRFDDAGVAWHGHRLGIAQLDAARERAVSFGSCSFREPVDELQAIGLLPPTPERQPGA